MTLDHYVHISLCGRLLSFPLISVCVIECCLTSGWLTIGSSFINVFYVLPAKLSCFVNL